MGFLDSFSKTTEYVGRGIGQFFEGKEQECTMIRLKRIRFERKQEEF